MSVKRTRTDGTRASVLSAVVDMLIVRQSASETYDDTMKDLAALPKESKLRATCSRDLVTQTDRIATSVKTLHGLNEKLLGDGEVFISKLFETLRAEIGELSKETQTKFYAAFPDQKMDVESAETEDK